MVEAPGSEPGGEIRAGSSPAVSMIGDLAEKAECAGPENRRP